MAHAMYFFLWGGRADANVPVASAGTAQPVKNRHPQVTPAYERTTITGPNVPWMSVIAVNICYSLQFYLRLIL